jgi:hypothetical protein
MTEHASGAAVDAVMRDIRPFTEQEMRVFEQDAKIGLVATVDGTGSPHLTLITSLQAKDPTHLTYGQFCEGLSKTHVKQNARTSFLIMSAQKEIWRGTALWTHEAKSGEDYETYNKKPMFRYNSYFGIHTVHCLDVITCGGREKLNVMRIALGALITMLSRYPAGTHAARSARRERVLKPWAEVHFARAGTLKFLSYVGSDGYPVIVPLVPCQSADSRRLVFAPTVYGRELAALPAGATVAVFALNLQMESVLVRGVFAGYRRYVGPRVGVINIDWVYNSMPPKQGVIYPVAPLQPVALH